MEIKKYATVKEMCVIYPFFTQPGLRHIILENRNGIKECMVRIGRKLLFDIEKFQTWLDKQKMEVE